ncbi:hypothetical protein [uncultured Cohaesibacter sp.]|uniref:hypothetical protein n=1 Tax=uncultured Cohaesibacter sp. TaxID=1002546 RepID=UPI00292D80CA|nr:hypothetical protein [uncultured Cohaesibacter sp.]
MTLKLTDVHNNIWGENLPFWFVIVARSGSLFLMISGLFYCLDILGVMGPSGLERGPWAASASRVLLACSFLIACIGVWQLSFWGVVMWGLSAIMQTTAISLIDNFIAFESIVSLIHLVGLLGLAASTGWVYYKACQQPDY